MHTNFRKFFAAARQGHFQALGKLLAAGVDLNIADKNRNPVFAGNTPVIYSARNRVGISFKKAHENGLRCLQLLLTAGADIRKVSERGYTAAMAAAEAGNDRALQVILEIWPAGVSQVDSQGRTALMYAARNKHTACVELLYLADPAGASVSDAYGDTAIGHAQQSLAPAPQQGYVLSRYPIDETAHRIINFLRTQRTVKELRDSIDSARSRHPIPAAVVSAPAAVFTDIL